MNPVVNEQILSDIIEEFRNFISGPGVSNNLLQYFNDKGDIAADYASLMTGDTTDGLNKVMKTYFSRIVEATEGSYSIREMITNDSVFRVDNSSNKIPIKDYFEIAYEPDEKIKFAAIIKNHVTDKDLPDALSVKETIRPLSVSTKKSITDVDIMVTETDAEESAQTAQQTSQFEALSLSEKEMQLAMSSSGYFNSNIPPCNG